MCNLQVLIEDWLNHGRPVDNFDREELNYMLGRLQMLDELGLEGADIINKMDAEQVKEVWQVLAPRVDLDYVYVKERDMTFYWDQSINPSNRVINYFYGDMTGSEADMKDELALKWYEKQR